MGHFPFVHTDVLGAEPHTEVREYEVEVSAERDEILATECRMFQPKAAASSSTGADVEYVYRVPHPYCGVLYKSSGLDPARRDVIAVFLQPVDEEHTRAHMLLSVLDDEHEDKEIRNFQQSIFGQDKPILENQYPKRLPLDPRAETPDPGRQVRRRLSALAQPQGDHLRRAPGRDLTIGEDDEQHCCRFLACLASGGVVLAIWLRGTSTRPSCTAGNSRCGGPTTGT